MMRRRILVASIALLSALLPMAQAQTETPTPDPVSNLYAIGPSYNQAAEQQIAGTFLYAHLAPQLSSTYLFTSVDALPTTARASTGNAAPLSLIRVLSSGTPATVTTNVGVGIAQRLATIAKMPIYCTTGAGPSWTGSNVGWQYNAGCLGAIHVSGNYWIMPTARFLKSSVSNGAGYQPIIGVLFGWGN